jgi:hypothetical protein
MKTPSPWDSRVFGMPTFEITNASRDELQEASASPGHYTVRVHPLQSKQDLHEAGFYYCDTLIQPYCTLTNFNAFRDAAATFSPDTSLDDLLPICASAFKHDRFHKDFQLQPAGADQRYCNWLSDLHAKGKVSGLLYGEQLAGFMAFNDNLLVLHALAPRFMGQGLAKFLWTAVCDSLFAQGHTEIVSSISVSNVPVLNLYARLGFKFREPMDIYHRLTR